MIKNVLLVDDDREMLLALREGFEKYRDSFAVFLAHDGVGAVESLRENVISLVVTDLKMPRMDGFELLAHIMPNYPDIPVIIITGYSTAQMERLAREGGAVGYIAKPFLIENLARQIMATLRKETEGGTLHNVSSGMFLQLMEMEQKTCTIRLEDKSTGQKGILFFREGQLMDARVNDQNGEEAAYKIFAWEQVNLSIQNGCPLRENRIHNEMQQLILEAARRKDEKDDFEKSQAAQTVTTGPVLEDAQSFESDPGNFISSIKKKIECEIGPSCGLEDVYQDASWDSRVSHLAVAGNFFHMGSLVQGYVDKGETSDYILLPGEKTTVLAVNPRCPRDKILQVLSD